MRRVDCMRGCGHVCLDVGCETDARLGANFFNLGARVVSGCVLSQFARLFGGIKCNESSAGRPRLFSSSLCGHALSECWEPILSCHENYQLMARVLPSIRQS